MKWASAMNGESAMRFRAVLVVSALMGLFIFALGPLPVTAEPIAKKSAATRCTEAGTDFVASLTPQLRQKALWEFDIEPRKVWSYMPWITGLSERNEGIAIDEMSVEQRKKAHVLFQCGFSSQGYQKTVSIMHLDDALNEERDQLPDLGRGDTPIGATFFWLAIFGDPTTEDHWAWQLEGHHIALNFTIVGDEIAVTPTFLGSDPAIVPNGPYAGWRVLGSEVDKGFDLLESLTDAQRTVAILSDEQMDRHVTLPGKGDALKQFEGLRAGDMTEDQKYLLSLLLDEYVLNYSDELAQIEMSHIAEAGFDNLYFAWIGPTERGKPVYYRVHGPSVIIEFDHAGSSRARNRGVPDPNHIHTIYRHVDNDFGEDILRRHYETSPHHQN